MQFADSLGANCNAEQRPETSSLIRTFHDVCGSGAIAEGLAALYAYESQIPTVSESKIDGLKKHYGFSDPKGYEYFSVHVEADREHSAAEREMLREQITDDNASSVRASVDRILTALWNLLSGVGQPHAIAC